jgi:metal-dependent amidase/aminoacylase/carboxypeptidase family protein
VQGGEKPNIIPDEAQCIFYARAPNAKELQMLRQKLSLCFEGAAVTTGCTVELAWDSTPYSNLCTNAPLAGEIVR